MIQTCYTIRRRLTRMERIRLVLSRGIDAVASRLRPQSEVNIPHTLVAGALEAIIEAERPMVPPVLKREDGVVMLESRQPKPAPDDKLLVESLVLAEMGLPLDPVVMARVVRHLIDLQKGNL